MHRAQLKKKTLLDPISWQLLVHLQENARISYSELARRVGLTTPAVIERVRRLEEEGVISGYRAEIDPQKLGLSILAIIRLNLVAIPFAKVIATARATPEVVECYRGTGGDSFIMKVAVSSVERLEEVIDRFTPFGITTTSVVLSSAMPRRSFSPEAAQQLPTQVARPRATAT